MNYIKTQKAKGIMYGINSVYNEFYYGEALEGSLTVPAHSLVRNYEEVIRVNTYPYFARPCPMTPRHGFVDSRIVKNSKDLINLMREVKLQDTDGEIILGKVFPDIFANAVYVSSGLVSIGPGNDGATGGNKSISFPVAPYTISARTRKNSGLSQRDTVYFESIHDGELWNMVQVRGGPRINPTSVDYIPKNIRIKHIIKPHNNLLQWEQDVKDFSPGTVVYGSGHTLASHAAIHCVLNKVPFITSYKPSIGKMTGISETKTAKYDRNQFKKGAKSAINICNKSEYTGLISLFNYSLSVLHNWAYLRNSEHASWLLGSAAMFYAKICLSLVVGECRYSKTLRKYKMGKPRTDIYNQVLANGVAPFSMLPEMFKIFYSEHWEEGYGGTSWANCALYTQKLWNNIAVPYNKKTKTLGNKEVTNIISVMNKVTNLAHNGGWWFDKIALEENLSFTSRYPGIAAFSICDVYMDVYNKVLASKNLSRELQFEPILDPAYTNSKGVRKWFMLVRPHKGMVKVALLTEDQDINCMNINITIKEEKYLNKVFNEKNVLSNNIPMTFPVNKNGTFKIGSSNIYSIKKIFGTK